MAFPSYAFADSDSDDTVVNATFGEELSITSTPVVSLKQDPGAQTGDLTPTKPVGGSATVDIISTIQNVSLTLSDQGTSGTPGHLQKVSGSGPSQLSRQLWTDIYSDVAWTSAADVTAFNENWHPADGFGSSQFTIATGDSNFSKTINFFQSSWQVYNILLV